MTIAESIEKQIAELQIVEKRLDELREYENNPRHNEGAVDAVAESIRVFGFRVPLVIDGEGVIVAGHTRKKAAEKLGLETVPCIVADDLSEEQVKAYRLADNKTGEFATWDSGKLEEEQAKILGIDLSRFGFLEENRVDYSQFFEEAEEKEKEPKTVVCPHCGEVNTIEN